MSRKRRKRSPQWKHHLAATPIPSTPPAQPSPLNGAAPMTEPTKPNSANQLQQDQVQHPERTRKTRRKHDVARYTCDSKALVDFCNNSGWTYRAIAEALGVSPSGLAGWLNRGRMPILARNALAAIQKGLDTVPRAPSTPWPQLQSQPPITDSVAKLPPEPTTGGIPAPQATSPGAGTVLLVHPGQQAQTLISILRAMNIQFMDITQRG